MVDKRVVKSKQRSWQMTNTERIQVQTEVVACGRQENSLVQARAMAGGKQRESCQVQAEAFWLAQTRELSGPGIGL